MKRIISVLAAASMLLPSAAASAADGTPSNSAVTADKTAQWTKQEAASNYDLRIHGWTDWETAAYIGFTLPDDFAGDKLASASLRLDTTYVSASGPAYIYSADYSAFESGAQYEGGNLPAYEQTELLSFTSPAQTGEFEIDLTDYVKGLSASSNAAFRIDVKSQTTNNGWVIGSLTNGGTPPKLVLDYGTGEAEPGTIANPKFANGLDDWTVDGTAAADSGALVITGGARVSQKVEGIEDGIYDLGAKVMTSDISGEAYVYAKANGAAAAKTAVPQSASYMTITVPGIEVKDGKLEVGIFAADKGEATVTVDDLTLTRSAPSRLPFLKGGEISKLTYVEDMGGKFFRADGTEADALQIMAENGFNFARIRLLDDPGKGHGQGGYYLPEGYLTLDDCLSLARRAKAKGMSIEFTIAYSDYWVDGEKQMIPHKWQEEINEKGLTGESLISYLEGKVYDYTKTSMQAMIDQGTCPEYVSVGNEMQFGILFNEWNNSNGLYNKADPLARLLNAGARAVRETAPQSKIILHSDNGGKVQKRSTFMNILSKVDFDVIGVSFYPFYNADVSIDTVVSEFNTLINKYNKDVIVMETGYNWDAKKADGWAGQLQNSGYYQNIYGESQNGQRAFLTELYAKLKTVLGGRCVGDLYWDPVMIHSKEWKIGWAVRESDDYTDSNVVPNSTIFDFDGKAVEGQKAMRSNANTSDRLLITGKLIDGEGGVLTNTVSKAEINGKTCTVTSDAYGEYIAAIPYSDTVEVNGESVAAPAYDLLIKGIDITAPDDTPADDYSISGSASGNTLNVQITDNVGTNPARAYIAAYEGSRLVNVKAHEITSGENSISEAITSGDTARVFLWDGIEPLAECFTASID